VSALLALATRYPTLTRLANSPTLPAVARSAVGLDGRRTRKAVIEALARRIETVQNPGALTEDDLAAAMRNAVNDTAEKREAARVAH